MWGRGGIFYDLTHRFSFFCLRHGKSLLFSLQTYLMFRYFSPPQASESQEEAVDTILTVTDRLFSSVGDAHEMVKQARQLAQVGSIPYKYQN